MSSRKKLKSSAGSSTRSKKSKSSAGSSTRSKKSKSSSGSSTRSIRKTKPQPGAQSKLQELFEPEPKSLDSKDYIRDKPRLKPPPTIPKSLQKYLGKNLGIKPPTII